MTNPNPLLPQGATPPKAKSNIYFKILMILAVHVVVIGGLLMQGCKDTKTSKATTGEETASANTNSMPMSTTEFPASTPASIPAAAPAPFAGTPSATPSIPATAPLTPATLPAATPLTPIASALTPTSVPAPISHDVTSSAATSGAKEYVVAQGDFLASIAKKNGVTLKALTEANPGVEPKKLQIGQKLQIPAATAKATSVAATSVAGEAATTAGTGESTTYTVKGGDVLLKIAKAHGTSVKAIMAANDLKTTSIRVGQKLKLPEVKMAMATPAATTGAAPTATALPATTAN